MLDGPPCRYELNINKSAFSGASPVLGVGFDVFYC